MHKHACDLICLPVDQASCVEKGNALAGVDVEYQLRADYEWVGQVFSRNSVPYFQAIHLGRKMHL